MKTLPQLTRFALTVACLTWALMLSGCQQSVEETSKPAEAPERQNPTILYVNGDPILRNELSAIANLAMSRGQRPAPQKVMELAIQQKLIYLEAKKLGKVISATEVDRTVETIASQKGGMQVLEQQLTQAGTSFEELKLQIEEKMTVQAMVAELRPKNAVVSDASVEAYYNNNLQMFKHPELLKARHILIKADRASASQEELDEAKERAEVIRQRLIVGEDFAKVAREVSEGPSGLRGGDLGPPFGKGDRRMPPEFKQAAFAQEPGKIGEVVQTQLGFHIILVEKHFEKGTFALDEVERDLQLQLVERQKDQVVAQWVNGLRQQAQIEYTEEGSVAMAGVAPPVEPPAGSGAKF